MHGPKFLGPVRSGPARYSINAILYLLYSSLFTAKLAAIIKNKQKKTNARKKSNTKHRHMVQRVHKVLQISSIFTT